MEKLNFNLEVTEHGNNPFDYWIVDNFLDYNGSRTSVNSSSTMKRKNGLVTMVGLL